MVPRNKSAHARRTRAGRNDVLYAGYVHPRDFHNLNCKSIRPPIAASEFMQSAPVPAIPFATPLEGDFARISTRASDISSFAPLKILSYECAGIPGMREREGGVWNFCQADPQG